MGKRFRKPGEFRVGAHGAIATRLFLCCPLLSALCLSSSCETQPSANGKGTLPPDRESSETPTQSKPRFVETVKRGAARPPRPLPKGLTGPPSLIDLEVAPSFVGRLQANSVLSPFRPSQYCVDDVTLYEGASVRMGERNIFAPKSVALTPLADRQVVVVWGAENRPLLRRLQKVGACPDNYQADPVQMRSDWVPPEGGPRTTSSQLEKLAYIEATKVQSLNLVKKLSETADSIRVQLKNPFKQTIDRQVLRLHFEGGPGKPGASYQERPVSIAPGASIELDIPLEIDPTDGKGGRRGVRKLQSLEMVGTLGKAQLDITIPIESLK